MLTRKQTITDILRALSYDVRVDIIRFLMDNPNSTGTTIISVTGMSQVMVSWHLKHLISSGIVSCTPHGREKHYFVVYVSKIAEIFAAAELLAAMQ